ncbi:phytochelatin synthase family protein [Thioclava sp. FR2]|uniref:phytochelatin synthase family protein n=1 Tax=Thioclava sp. FR2 TaxID=3445780 RepID=UPI003EBD2112
MRCLTALSLSIALLSTPSLAETTAEAPAPKLGPNAVPVTADNAFLRANPAPDYWAFGPFVKPQFTTSACSIATVTAAVNGLSGLPPHAENTVTTQPQMLEAVGNAEWAALSAEGGDGVTFAQLEEFTKAALNAKGMALTVSSFHPARADEANLTEMRRLLTENEKAATDALLIYFNQGVVTGDWDGPHISLIGAYDAATDRVLILEVDQEWYVPYWTPAPVLLEAMVKPTSAEHGPLEGQTGGFVRIGG